MISKSKRMRYRWICIEGNLDCYLKDMKINFKLINPLKSDYKVNRVQLMVYRGDYINALFYVYHFFYIKNIDMSNYKIKVKHCYKSKD